MMQREHRCCFLWPFLAAVSLVDFVCRADCADLGSLSDQFALAPLVARVRLAEQCIDLPCYFEVWEKGGYTNRKAMHSYQVIQVFKGDGLTVGQDIPLIYSTDTGRRLRNPDDDEDFLAFMAFYSVCEQDDTAEEASSYYSVSECFSASKKWSALTVSELQFLNVTQNDIPVETDLDADCPLGCNCARWRLLCRFVCWFRRLFS